MPRLTVTSRGLPTSRDVIPPAARGSLTFALEERGIGHSPVPHPLPAGKGWGTSRRTRRACSGRLTGSYAPSLFVLKSEPAAQGTAGVSRPAPALGAPIRRPLRQSALPDPLNKNINSGLADYPARRGTAAAWPVTYGGTGRWEVATVLALGPRAYLGRRTQILQGVANTDPRVMIHLHRRINKCGISGCRADSASPHPNRRRSNQRDREQASQRYRFP